MMSAGSTATNSIPKSRTWSSRIVAPFRSFPSPVAAMAGAAVLGLFRELRTQPVRNRSRTSRRGQVEHKPVAISPASARPPRLAHSPRATSCRKQHRHHRQLRRAQPRLAPHRIHDGEIRIRIPRPQLIADPDGQRPAPAERRLRHPGGSIRNLRPRLRLHRHDDPILRPGTGTGKGADHSRPS